MLKRKLPMLCGPDTILLQDNAPIHTYGPVQKWFASSDYTIMEWPPYSLDLNSIEHCWFPLKNNTHHASPRLLEMTGSEAEAELHRVLPGAWDMIENNDFMDLIRTMLARVNAIIESQG